MEICLPQDPHMITGSSIGDPSHGLPAQPAATLFAENLFLAPADRHLEATLMQPSFADFKRIYETSSVPSLAVVEVEQPYFSFLAKTVILLSKQNLQFIAQFPPLTGSSFTGSPHANLLLMLHGCIVQRGRAFYAFEVIMLQEHALRNI